MGAACCGQNQSNELEIHQYNSKISPSFLRSKLINNNNIKYNNNPLLEKISIIQLAYKIHLSKRMLKSLFSQAKKKACINIDNRKLINEEVVLNSKSEQYYQDLLLNSKIKSFFEHINIDPKLKQQLKLTDKFSFCVPNYIVMSPKEVYKGSWNVNEKYSGYGVVYEFNDDKTLDSRTEGIFIRGELKGYGRKILSNEELLMGEFFENKLNGIGEYHRNDGSIYKGNFMNGLPHGNGKEIYIDGASFEGFYLSGEKKYGKYLWKDGNYYQGDFSSDLFNGRGVYRWAAEGNYYDGEWKNGKMDGKGKLVNSDGSYYDGQFQEGRKNGDGKYFWKKNIYYDGGWKDDKQNGFGTYCKNGKKVKGFWANGKILSNTGFIDNNIFNNNGRKSFEKLKTDYGYKLNNNGNKILGKEGIKNSDLILRPSDINTNKHRWSQTSHNFRTKKASIHINDLIINNDISNNNNINENMDKKSNNNYNSTETANIVRTSNYNIGKFNYG